MCLPFFADRISLHSERVGVRFYREQNGKVQGLQEVRERVSPRFGIGGAVWLDFIDNGGFERR